MRSTPSLPRASMLAAAGLSLLLAGCGNSSEPTQLAFVAEPQVYGDDVMLDLYWEACDEVGGLACDTLWRLSPIGSRYEAFGAECGGRGPARACASDVASDPAAPTGIE